MKKIRIVGFLLSVVMLSTLCASCGKEQSSGAKTPEKPAFVQVKENGSRSDKEVGFQLEAPAAGEEIAVLHIKGMSDIRMRLFPQEAPIAVANFKGLISNGYYDGIAFHRLEPNFVIQGGDPEGTGTGGESVWGGDFEYEVNKNLLHFRGALAMAHSSKPSSNGSQFYIVQTKKAQGATQGYNPSEKAVKLYEKWGGTPSLDGDYTVFGQVFEEDMKVVDEIIALANTQRTAVIEKAELVKYQ